MPWQVDLGHVKTPLIDSTSTSSDKASSASWSVRVFAWMHSAYLFCKRLVFRLVMGLLICHALYSTVQRASMPAQRLRPREVVASTSRPAPPKTLTDWRHQLQYCVVHFYNLLLDNTLRMFFQHFASKLLLFWFSLYVLFHLQRASIPLFKSFGLRK